MDKEELPLVCLRGSRTHGVGSFLHFSLGGRVVVVVVAGHFNNSVGGVMVISPDAELCIRTRQGSLKMKGTRCAPV